MKNNIIDDAFIAEIKKDHENFVNACLDIIRINKTNKKEIQRAIFVNMMNAHNVIEFTFPGDKKLFYIRKKNLERLQEIANEHKANS